jgi:hypothetical protein
MSIIQNNRVLSAPVQSVGGQHYVQVFSYDVGQGVVKGIMEGLEVRTNTTPNNPTGPEVTALGRGIGSGTPGEGVITIPNRLKAGFIRGHLRLRTAGSNDGWANDVTSDGGAGASIDDSYFMDGLAITGKNSSGGGHTWLWGVLNLTYNTLSGQGYRPDFVGASDFQQWATTHGGSYTGNWEYWFNQDDPQGRPAAQDFYFERDLTGLGIDGDILIRIQSNQGWANEDTGIEQCTIWLAPEDKTHLQASDGNVRSYESHGILSHKLGDQNGYVEEKRWKNFQSSFSNPPMTIGQAFSGATNHHMHFVVEVAQSAYTSSSYGFNVHRGMAAFVSGASTPHYVSSMTTLAGTNATMSSVGSLSWSGDNLIYTPNRQSNYDDYWVKVTYYNTGSGNFVWSDGFSRNSTPYPLLER